MKTVDQRVKNIQRLKKKAYSVYIIVRPKYIKTINEELELMRSRYKEADQVTKNKFKNEAIGLKMILKELEI